MHDSMVIAWLFIFKNTIEQTSANVKWGLLSQLFMNGKGLFCTS